MAEDATIVEKMLLMQAVYETGNANWETAAEKLADHPLLEKDSLLSTEAGCIALYEHLLASDAPQVGGEYPEGNKPKAKVHEQIAKKYFMERVGQLRSAIFEEEERFKTLHREIEEIKAGIWDERINAEAAAQLQNGNPETASPTSPSRRSSHRRKSSKDSAVAAIVENAGNSLEEDAVKITQQEERNLAQDGNILPSIEPEAEKQQETEMASPPTRGRKGRPPKIQIEPQKLHPAQTKEVSAAETKEEATLLEAVEEDLTPMTQDEDQTPTGEAPKKGTKGKPKKKDGKRKRREASIAESEASERGRKRAKTEDSEANTPVEVDPAVNRRWKTAIGQILAQMNAEPNSSIFRDPVRKVEAPSYHILIKQPMDLKTLGRRVRDGTISTTADFKHDLLLIFSNAVMFNQPDSDVAIMARKMARAAEALLEAHRVGGGE